MKMKTPAKVTDNIAIATDETPSADPQPVSATSAATLKVIDASADCAPVAEAVTVNIYVPSAVGVPEIVPVELKTNPAGKSSDVNVMPVAPLADKVALNSEPT